MLFCCLDVLKKCGEIGEVNSLVSFVLCWSVFVVFYGFKNKGGIDGRFVVFINVNFLESIIDKVDLFMGFFLFFIVLISVEMFKEFDVCVFEVV